MRRCVTILLLLLLLLLLGLAAPALADERILAFHSDIEVFADGTMQVTETLRVQAEGKQIRRGIYRDFPTDYRDGYGNRYRVGFEVVRVERDGRPEAFHTKAQGKGVRVYMGREGVYLHPGGYTYALTYRTNRQLGFFDDHDELYWNVTGNDWAFTMDEVSASVHLPPEIPADAIGGEAYTGPRGAQGTDYRYLIDPTGEVRFETTRPLDAGEGLTIVVTWPKGYVAAPTAEEKLAYFLGDNRVWGLALLGLALLGVYYLWAWARVGRDPEEGVIFPQYEPPAKFSPASSRYIRRMGYDNKAFAAALVNLAVKGLIEIREEDKEYTLVRTGAAPADLAAGEKVLLRTLFDGESAGGTGAPTARLVLENSNHSRIGKALKAHKQALVRDYEKRYFVTNRGWLIPGLLLSVGIFAGVLLFIPDPERRATGAFLSLWLTLWSGGVTMLLLRAWRAWRSADGAAGYLGALFMSAFALPFVAGEVFAFWTLTTQVSPAVPVVVLLAFAVNLLFYHLLKAPTLAGRRLLDLLEGFRLYLDVAEKDEMNLRNPPQKTPQLFERYLPYALALDVEQHWSERFAAVFRDLEASGQSVQPGWYHGSHWDSRNLGGFSTAVGSALGSAVGSASTAPGSSSGSGGGGSSGGGGGGGGGGGW